MARRISKTLKAVIWIVGVIIGIVILVSVIGKIGDKAVSGEVKQAGQDALEYFSKLQKDGEGNAWVYYEQAMKAASGIASDRELTQYLEGEEEPTFKLMKDILDNLQIIDIIREGARQDYCAIPHAYEDGLEAPLPEYVALRRAVSITCVKALYDLENGRSDEAIDLLFSAMMVGKHVASSPMIMDQMIGFALVGRALKVLEIGISTRAFDERQLDEVAGFLDDMEKHWPLLSDAISADMKLMRISFAKQGENVTSLMVMGGDGIREFGFLRMLALRVLCWRDWFSPIRTMHNCFAFYEDLDAELRGYEGVLLDETASKEVEEEKGKSIKNKVDSFRKRNFWFAIACPEYPSMFKRKIERITMFRILNLSSSLASYRLTKGRFPEKLVEIAPHLIVDLQTREPWMYVNYGDSARISSPCVDAGDTIAVTITNMSIGTYLEKKRLKALEKKEKEGKKK